jgi:hypothetical protein
VIKIRKGTHIQRFNVEGSKKVQFIDIYGDGKSTTYDFLRGPNDVYKSFKTGDEITPAFQTLINKCNKL